MTHSVRVTPVEQIPSDVRVCHVDELGWPAKDHLANCDEDDPVDVDKQVAEAFECCDIVKYTDYYEVSVR